MPQVPLTAKFSRKKRAVFAVIAIFMGIVGGLIFAEVAFRLISSRAQDDTERVRTRDPFLHHAFRANSNGLLRWGDRLVPYFINSLGFRDRQSRDVLRRPSSGRRIVLLGDSLVEGPGVSYEHSLSGLLDQEFRKRGMASEVLNGAVVSYSPFLEYRRLRQFFEAGFRATQIVLFVDISDVQDEAMAEYHLLGENEPFPSGVRERVLPFFRTSRVAQEVWETRFFTSQEQKDLYYEARKRWTEDKKLFKEYGVLGVKRCKKNIMKINDLARSNEARLRIVLYPWPVQLQSRRKPSIYETIFIDFADRNRIPVTNLTPYFRSLPVWRDHFLADEVHWNELGHRLVATHLLRDLVRDLQ